jgi:hypothetical protein
MNRRDIAIRQFVASALALFALLFVLGHCVGCFEEPLQIAAASGYAAQQMRCVEQYAKKADIDRCRNRVKLAWMVDSGADAQDGAK